MTLVSSSSSLQQPSSHPSYPLSYSNKIQHDPNQQDHRKYYLDWVRTIAVWLVVAVHIVEAIRWTVKDRTREQSDVLKMFQINLLQIGMPIFFYVAGRSAALTKKNATFLSFLMAKLRRLFLPLIPGLFIFVTLAMYFARHYHPSMVPPGQQANNFWDFLQVWPDVFKVIGLDWLWFLPCLLVISLLSYPVIGIARNTAEYLSTTRSGYQHLSNSDIDRNTMSDTPTGSSGHSETLNDEAHPVGLGMVATGSGQEAQQSQRITGYVETELLGPESEEDDNGHNVDGSGAVGSFVQLGHITTTTANTFYHYDGEMVDGHNVLGPPDNRNHYDNYSSVSTSASPTPVTNYAHISGHAAVQQLYSNAFGCEDDYGKRALNLDGRIVGRRTQFKPDRTEASTPPPSYTSNNLESQSLIRTPHSSSSPSSSNTSLFTFYCPGSYHVLFLSPWMGLSLVSFLLFILLTFVLPTPFTCILSVLSIFIIPSIGLLISRYSSWFGRLFLPLLCPLVSMLICSQRLMTILAWEDFPLSVSVGYHLFSFLFYTTFFVHGIVCEGALSHIHHPLIDRILDALAPVKMILIVAFVANGFGGTLRDHAPVFWAFPVFESPYKACSYIGGSWCLMWAYLKLSELSFDQKYHDSWFKFATESAMLVYLSHGLFIQFGTAMFIHGKNRSIGFSIALLVSSVIVGTALLYTLRIYALPRLTIISHQLVHQHRQCKLFNKQQEQPPKSSFPPL